jgi:hypothetical protein
VCIERGQRLVEKEDVGVTGERAREADALALAAGELARPGAGEVGDPEALEQLVGAAVPTECDVPAHPEMGEERVVLEDVADRALLRWPADAALRVEPDLVAEDDPACVGPRQPGDEAQYRRLPRARRPDERDGLGADLQPEL